MNQVALINCSMHMSSRFVLAVLITVATGSLSAQSNPQAEREFDSLYAIRIEMDEIDGVYIPEDLNDAFNELSRLSSREDLEKFKEAPEDVIRSKLHFGLGRWMIHNWGFYQGSRLSHYLTELGLEHPDDMAGFMLVSFHRYLNGQPLQIEKQVAHYKEIRDQERLEREKEKEVIHKETRIKKNK